MTEPIFVLGNVRSTPFERLGGEVLANREGVRDNFRCDLKLRMPQAGRSAARTFGPTKPFRHKRRMDNPGLIGNQLQLVVRPSPA